MLARFVTLLDGRWMTGLRRQMLVVAALVLRDLKTRFGKHGWMWLLLEPALHCGLLLLVFSTLGRHSPLPGLNAAEFMLSGVIPWLFYQRAASQVAHSLESNRVLLTFAQVTPLDLALSRAAIEFLIMYLVTGLFLFGKWLVGLPVAIADPLSVLYALSVLNLLGFGVGLVVSVGNIYIPGLTRVFSFVNRLVYFISGVFFTLWNTPSVLLPYVDWNPLLHCIQWARFSYFGMVDDMIKPSIPIVVCAVLLAVGLCGERLSRRMAKESME